MKHWDINAITLDGRAVAGAIATAGSVYPSEADEAFEAADTAAIVTLGSRLQRSSFTLQLAREQQPRGEQRVWLR
jgi:hypothetical protein